ncbi:MAG: VF530 family protein [Pseudobdellovibrio sp.]|uniref:VF530 family protein n=1 Tax=Pseudobdellovibrio sp. HCB154 TaxID=3386277 RepID=UPI00391731D4|nr:VF530 family protein [Pseudobdellovibrio sp.]
MNKVQQNLSDGKPALEGITLETMVTELVENYGWQRLSEKISINSFTENPSIKSSLKFLRKTPWARLKVEQLYTWRAKTGWDPRDNAK